MGPREVDYVVIGAGMAGMTAQRMLRGESSVLLDPRPGKYKIGESIIPQHFADALMDPLVGAVHGLPSATPKDATVFVSDDSVSWFPLFRGPRRAVHVDRRELEEATAKHFGTEITRERVEGVDVDEGLVTTDQGTWRARRLVIDCSGPARILARALGHAREVWPVWASWAYHDVVDADANRFWEDVERGGRVATCFDNVARRLVPGKRDDPFDPVHTTTLTRVSDGVWTWQIPLWNARLLSVGVVSRHGAIREDEYRDVVGRTLAPQFRASLRAWDGSGPHNAFHVRNRFAWTSDRFAGDRWALVGDAAFFGDPVYSVGTGLATNHAIQLGQLVTEGGWSPEKAEAYHRHTAKLFERAKRAYDHWYFGRVTDSADAAVEIQSDFLNGEAFQVRSTKAYVSMWEVSGPADGRRYADRQRDRGVEVTPQMGFLLDEGEAHLAGWAIAKAHVRNERLELEWSRSDAAPLTVVVCRREPGEPYFADAGAFGLRYRTSEAVSDSLDGQGRALMKAIAGAISAREDALIALLPASSGRAPVR